MTIDDTLLDALLSALGEQLGDLGVRHEMVVVGGSALLALGFVLRTTRDVDVVALVEGGELLSADPLPASLQTAAARVARDFDLSEDWLNPGPSDLLRWGLPNGFWSRVTSRGYGDPLVVHFAGRFDQIHFKLFAMVDQGAGRHEADLRALQRTRSELVAAANWTITHDPSPGFREILHQTLGRLGVDDADLRT